jgi:hypothetical protein
LRRYSEVAGDGCADYTGLEAARESAADSAAEGIGNSRRIIRKGAFITFGYLKRKISAIAQTCSAEYFWRNNLYECFKTVFDKQCFD